MDMTSSTHSKMPKKLFCVYSLKERTRKRERERERETERGEN